MKINDSFFITRREFPKDETSISAKLLIKSGMIMKMSNGIYSYLPIGLKVINNIIVGINHSRLALIYFFIIDKKYFTYSLFYI